MVFYLVSNTSKRVLSREIYSGAFDRIFHIRNRPRDILEIGRSLKEDFMYYTQKEILDEVKKWDLLIWKRVTAFPEDQQISQLTTELKMLPCECDLPEGYICEVCVLEAAIFMLEDSM